MVEPTSISRGQMESLSTGMNAISLQQHKDKLTTATHWSNDPCYPVEAWQVQVFNGGTRLGYWEWIEHSKKYAELNDKISLE